MAPELPTGSKRNHFCRVMERCRPLMTASGRRFRTVYSPCPYLGLTASLRLPFESWLLCFYVDHEIFADL
jgi:hypothetical protein